MLRVTAFLVSASVVGAFAGARSWGAYDATSAPPPVAPSVHEVRMVLEDGAYKFSPANVTARPGDRVTFVVGSGAPHNVAFDPALIPDDVEPTLSANMPQQMSPLAGPLLTKDGETYTISLDGVKPGTYAFFCMPHVGMAMKGAITVK